MVHLVLSSTKGNQGQRYFPHAGYLGLTPIRVEGIVRTKLDADQKRLPAKSITISIRCYESRIGRVNALQSNLLVDLTHTLWSKPDDVDYEPIGNLEFPFRLSIPAKVAGFSTAVFVDYRCMWRIEAVLQHSPIFGVGSRQIRHSELPLIRYDVPSVPRHIPAPSFTETTKLRAPRIRYAIYAPKVPIGPQDLVSIPIHLQPIDPAVSIRSASVIIERRITLHDVSDPLPPLSRVPSAPVLHDLVSEPASSSSTLTPNSIFPATSSASLASENTPLISQPPSSSSGNSTTSSAKVIVNLIAGVESSGSFAKDARGIYSKTLTLQWPAPKSHSRWAIGESINSDLVSVKYYIRTKIIVTSSTGTESIELADEELLIVSTNEAERQLALAKYNETHVEQGLGPSSAGPSRSKSKSPRRSRPAETSGDAIPSVPSSAGTTAPSSYPRAKASSSRRPHTSAGPRDRPVDFAGGAYGRTRSGGDSVEESQRQRSEGLTTSAGEGGGTTSDGGGKRRRFDTLIGRPGTSHSTSSSTTTGAKSTASGGISLVGGRNSASFWSTVHTNGVQPPKRRKEKERSDSERSRGDTSTSTSTSGSVSSVSAGSSNGPGTHMSRRVVVASDDLGESTAHMKEWEEELARIEARSRRSSDLLGFAGKMKRLVGRGGPVPVPSVAVSIGARGQIHM